MSDLSMLIVGQCCLQQLKPFKTSFARAKQQQGQNTLSQFTSALFNFWWTVCYICVTTGCMLRWAAQPVLILRHFVSAWTPWITLAVLQAVNLVVLTCQATTSCICARQQVSRVASARWYNEPLIYNQRQDPHMCGQNFPLNCHHNFHIYTSGWRFSKSFHLPIYFLVFVGLQSEK